MKIALIGYGKMGHAIEAIAKERGHEIVSIIDVRNIQDFESAAFRSADVAIEFTAPSEAMNNYYRCFAAGIPVVAGTTGWLEHLPQIKEYCANGETFFYASNYSLGMNIFFEINRRLAKIMNDFPSYQIRMEEVHHIHKLDAPSGTAISLAEDLIENIDRKTAWVLDPQEPTENEIGIKAFREGEVPGIHTVVYESDVDSIRIAHDAKNREGLALGAVIAAEFTCGKKGFLTMQDMLKF